MRSAIIVAVIILSSATAFAESQPYAGMQARAIKTLSEQQIADCRLAAEWASRLRPN
jgi:hypothetical protein